MEMAEDEVKQNRYDTCEKAHEQILRAVKPVDSDFRSAFFVRIFQPGNKSEDRHGHRHSEIGHHFSVIREGIGDDAI